MGRQSGLAASGSPSISDRVLCAESVSVRIGTVTLLERVSCRFEPGRLHVVIGANGAGKTTLVRALTGVAATADGVVRLGERAVAAMTAKERARAIALLPQGTSVHWPIDVESLVALGRLPRAGDTSRADDRRATGEAMLKADLGGFAHRSVRSLSGGELARVFLARALAVEADVLVADEPVANLDPYHQLKVMEILAAEAGRGRTVITVMHDLALAGRFADRMLLLEHGQITADGTPAEVLTSEHLARAYRIESAEAIRDGVRVIVPWRRLDADAAE